MRGYSLLLPVMLLITIANLTPHNYIGYWNVTQTYKTDYPQLAAGLQTAYEYTVSGGINNSLRVKIANYKNYTEAQNVYNLFYGLGLNHPPGSLVPLATLDKQIDFSQIQSLENYSEFSFVSHSIVTFSTLYLLVNNSVVQIIAIGENATQYSPLMDVHELSGLPMLQSEPTVTTTIAAVTPAPQVAANYTAAYVLIALVIIVLIIIVAYAFKKRHMPKN